MARRPTIQDIAQAAGVSVATVDRVLNGRLKVREETARKVSEAAHRIGYHATNLIEQRLRADLPELRVGFILQKIFQPFYQNVAAEIEDAMARAAGIRGKAVIEFAQTQTPADIANLMVQMRGRVDVVAANAVNHVQVTEAVLTLKEAGIPTCALFNDFAQGERLTYIGTNNLKVGRMAAWMVGTAARRAGKIAVFVGGHRWHGHELRETGFRSYFREARKDFQVLDTLVNLETRQLTYEATLNLLDRNRDLVGLYLAGGGMEGAIQALRENRKPGDVALVVNELTPESRSALGEGYLTMVIATPLRQLFPDLVDLIKDHVLGENATVPSQKFLEPILYVPESV
ncbi:Transcriptional regulator, LacI family [Candidatus Rhodobacter oscarellae]|uniref:Transcriptional regulator, LacI family n=1 Tax=Candidatus Rhodobacter oscarellae TaxID=1675527 RepID=A0A0J9EBU1_9RHOB|nr:LacI family DNA-binding transcriptional regulator [Candidatus Rhodobacter lobularis]KMW59144.1 Transcriptional regulator, LacI family [Candidatus Rhodobacter lobularis]